MNRLHLYLYGMLIAVLCFSTTAYAVEDRMTDKGSRIAPSVIDIHKGVMLAGGATELSPMLKKKRRWEFSISC